jgi:hypothetical protein
MIAQDHMKLDASLGLRLQIYDHRYQRTSGLQSRTCEVRVKDFTGKRTARSAMAGSRKCHGKTVVCHAAVRNKSSCPTSLHQHLALHREVAPRVTRMARQASLCHRSAIIWASRNMDACHKRWSALRIVSSLMNAFAPSLCCSRKRASRFSRRVSIPLVSPGWGDARVKVFRAQEGLFMRHGLALFQRCLQ